ncbi:MAG: CDP-alcohol phosphatidyltransferase family protein [Acidobacteria bacterium]|nr:CDP-alcohol phosphatidyltransferase family protein [Acidobacteriota bacterium]
MFDDPFRSSFARLVTPLGQFLVSRDVTPSSISWTGFAIAVAGAAAIGANHGYVGLALWLVSRVADGLDGVVARLGGRHSAFGGYLDITLDMAAYSLMVVAFAYVHPAPAVLWPAILAGYVLAITTTLALSSAAERLARTVAAGDRSFQFTRGLAEAGETTVVYALWVVFPSHVALVGWLWAGLLLATAIQRSCLAWRLLPRHHGH